MRRIIHVDMDAFYASVEQRDRPELRGTPVAVGGRPERRGVVAASSYEARAFGVRSAMSMARAVAAVPAPRRSCRPTSRSTRPSPAQVFGIFRAVTPLVEPLSLDEAYLDVTENAWGEPLAVNVARRLKAQIRETTGLTASAGVAPNKFLAKIASGWKKPDGLTVVAPERVESFLQRLPVDALWGVGPVTAARLRSIGLERLVDVRQADPELLRRTVGQSRRVARRAGARHRRPARRAGPAPQVGRHREHLRRRPRRPHANRRGDAARWREEDAAWLSRKSLFARTVTIKVRYGDFTTVTRSDTRLPATRDAGSLARRAVALLDRTEAGTRPVRLLGVSLHGLVDHPQPPAPRPAGRSGALPFDDEGGGGVGPASA